MKTILILNLMIAFVSFQSMATDSKISFWDSQRRGTNLFNSVEKIERMKSAKDFGVEIVRIAPNKWLNGRPASEEGDFLLGRPGTFKTINEKDVLYLKKVLDDADKVGLKVILTMLSLPNARWKQHNNDIEERKIWESFDAQEASFSFWKQLAAALKGHPALIGYNIRNEPSPELAEPNKFKDWYTGDYAAWYVKIKGTPSDINLFYQKAVKAVREVDKDIPIVLDSGFYATAWGFKVLEPINDDKIIYSFHMYEPYQMNSQFNKGRFKYPGPGPIGEIDNAPVLKWNKAQLEKFLEPIYEWQKKNSIPSNRIFVGEFGYFRSNAGAEPYLRDITEIFNSKKWHWAFYSFREDTWAGMDYELGTAEKAGWKYWKAIESGKIPGPDIYKPNVLSKVLKEALKAKP